MRNVVYDNGEKLLGTKRDIVADIHNQMLTQENDEEFMEILKDLTSIADDSIVMINYDCAMGYTIDYWDKDDMREID